MYLCDISNFLVSTIFLLDFGPVQIVCYQWCTRLAAASDKTNRRWFSPGTPASSTTKSGRHDNIVEILLKINQIKLHK
jgi:hypothetical protein